MRTVIYRALTIASLAGMTLSTPLLAEPEIRGQPSELAAYLATLPGTVQITGEAEIKTPANRAIVSLRIDTENKSFAAALKENQAIQAKLMQFLAEKKIAADRVRPAPFSATPKHAVFSDKVKGYKVGTLVKVTITDQREFNFIAQAADQFTEVVFVSSEFEHSDEDQLRAQAIGKACEEAERQKTIYEQKLGIKLAPRNIRDQTSPPEPLPSRGYGSDSGYAASSLSRELASPAKAGGAGEVGTVGRTAFGELVFSARVAVEYTVSPAK